MDALGWIAGGSVAAGLVATVGASCWQQIRQFGRQLTRHVFAEIELSNSAADAMAYYLSRQAWQSPLHARVYAAGLIHLRSRRREQLVAWEMPPNREHLFWLNRRYPLWFNRQGEGGKLRFLQGTLDPDELIFEAMELHNREVYTPLPDAARYRIEQCYGTAGKGQLENFVGAVRGMAGQRHTFASAESDVAEVARASNLGPSNPEMLNSADFRTRRFVRWSLDELGPALENATASALDQLALPVEARQLVERIRRWKTMGDDFHSRGLPWQIKILLEGAPGTGKTSFVRALAEDENWPVYVLNLASFYDEELGKVWRKAAQNAPCIVLIEDIDHVFHGRENVVEHSPLTHDALLNCLDGVQRTSGVITIMTSNHPDKLDEALTRPGRVDVRLTMTKPDYEGRVKICRRILHGCEEIWERIIALGDRDTGAEFEKRCGEAYLKLCGEREKEAELAEFSQPLLGAAFERLRDARAECLPGVG